MQIRIPAVVAESLKGLAQVKLIETVKLIRMQYGLGLGESKRIADALRFGDYTESDGNVYIQIPSRQLDLPASGAYVIIFLNFEGEVKCHPTNHLDEGWREVQEWGHVPLSALKMLEGLWIKV